MEKLSRADLMSLEQYAEARPEFKAQVIEHKKDRRLALGTNASLHFEDRLTMQYQVQEMLRIERIFEAAGIRDVQFAEACHHSMAERRWIAFPPTASPA